MATVVRQNFVSETTTTLKLKVAATVNWGFLPSDIESCYTHPLSSSFTPLMSDKSLQLCTENLGSETGSDTVTDGSSIFSCSPGVDLADWKGNRTSPRNHCENPTRKARDFPPPLTTMSRSTSLQLRRLTEGGRLIIEAVETPSRNSYLQADRSGGRLRLSFLTVYDAEEATCSTAAGEENEEDECGEAEERIEEFESEEVEDEGIELDGETNLGMEMGKFRRVSRCKEGSHGSKELNCNWKPPLWVATS